MQNKLNCKSAKAICQHKRLYLSYLFCAFDNEKEHPNSMLGKFKPSKRKVGTTDPLIQLSQRLFLFSGGIIFEV